MTIATLYLFLVVLPNMHAMATGPILVIPVMLLIIAVFLGIGSIFQSDAGEMTHAKLFELAYRCGKWAVSLILLCVVVSVFTPSSSQVYMLSGAYVATNAEDIAKLPDNLVGAANAWLKDVAEAKEQQTTQAKKPS